MSEIEKLSALLNALLTILFMLTAVLAVNNVSSYEIVVDRESLSTEASIVIDYEMFLVHSGLKEIESPDRTYVAKK